MLLQLDAHVGTENMVHISNVEVLVSDNIYAMYFS